MFGLQGSVTKSDASADTLLNFWRHEDNPLERIKKHDPPYMAKESIQQQASDYLSLPYRAPRLERLLVDILIALELYPNEMFREEPFQPLRVFSPIKQRHTLASLLDSNQAASTRRVRDLASKAADAGVVWPNPLFAVLDDNISRIGRL